MPNFLQLAAAARAAQNETELTRLATIAMRPLGFDYFAVVSHLAKRILLSSLPPRLLKLASAGYWEITPISRLCAQQTGSFLWSDVLATKAATAGLKSLFRTARMAGVKDGYTVPTNLPSLAPCAVSFLRKREILTPRYRRSDLHYLGCGIFDAYRAITATRDAHQHRPILSPRQSQCVKLAAQGNSDIQIASRLGISKETAHKHIQVSMQRLGVHSRAQMVARALYLSIFTFEDVLVTGPSSV